MCVCMHAHVCMCVCVHACMHVCMHACMHARMHACMHACIHACMHAACRHACMHACMCMCMLWTGVPSWEQPQKSHQPMNMLLLYEYLAAHETECNEQPAHKCTGGDVSKKRSCASTRCAQVIHLLADWLMDRSIACLLAWLIDRLNDRSIDWMTEWLNYWLIDCLNACQLGWLIY